MKEFEFNPIHKAWDRYRQFHCMYLPFVEFEHGQLMVISLPDPHERRMYDKYGIQIVTTTDSAVPSLYLNREDEKPIPKAWVQQGGQQYLAVDHEQGVAVALGHSYYRHRSSYENNAGAFMTTVPDHLASYALAYWAGPKRLPVSNKPIVVSKPDPHTMKELAPKLAEVRPALHAIQRMKSEPERQAARWRHHGKVDVKAEWIDMTTEQLVGVLSRDELTLNSAVLHGFASKRIQSEVPYLYVKGE